MSDGVRVFMRIEGQREVPIGTVGSMSEVAELLRWMAGEWQKAADDKKLYEPGAS